MAEEDHEELSPLHRLQRFVDARLETNERHADRHPDKDVRYNAKIRAEVYRLMRAEVRDAITIAAKTQVDRAVAARKTKETKVVTEAAVRAMAEAKVT